MDDTISRQAAIEAIKEDKIDLTNPNVVAVFKATGDFEKVETQVMTCDRHIKILKDLPSAQPEHLTDDDFETIRIHLSAFKESLCNQCRWKEAEDYEMLISRFMSFASAQPERKHGYWIESNEHVYMCNEVKEWTNWYCSECDAPNSWPADYCPNCGARMEVDDESN